MSRRDEQLVDDAAEVAALLEQPDDAEDAQLVDELGDVPDDDSPTPTREQVRVAALLCAHATSGTDLDDLAGVLGVRHAVEPAERWLNALSRAAAEPAAHEMPCDVTPEPARSPMAQALLEHLVPDAEAPADETPDHDKVAAVSEAIARGDFIVCMTRCYACQFGECLDPPAWHTWAEKDDVEHAKATGQPDPSQSRCGCSCAVVLEEDARRRAEQRAEERAHAAVLAAGPQPCEVCGANVTAQKIAETGRARHPWHPEGS